MKIRNNVTQKPQQITDAIEKRHLKDRVRNLGTYSKQEKAK